MQFNIERFFTFFRCHIVFSCISCPHTFFVLLNLSTITPAQFSPLSTHPYQILWFIAIDIIAAFGFVSQNLVSTMPLSCNLLSYLSIRSEFGAWPDLSTSQSFLCFLIIFGVPRILYSIKLVSIEYYICFQTLQLFARYF